MVNDPPPRPYRLGIVLVLVAALLAGLVFLGRWGVRELKSNERYQAAIGDIECDAPPGLTRAEFLDEVRYLGRLPVDFSVLDKSFHEQLRKAFADHPWVQRVEAIEIVPPRHVIIRLSFRDRRLSKNRRHQSQIALRISRATSTPVVGPSARQPGTAFASKIT